MHNDKKNRKDFLNELFEFSENNVKVPENIEYEKLVDYFRYIKGLNVINARMQALLDFYDGYNDNNYNMNMMIGPITMNLHSLRHEIYCELRPILITSCAICLIRPDLDNVKIEVVKSIITTICVIVDNVKILNNVQLENLKIILKLIKRNKMNKKINIDKLKDCINCKNIEEELKNYDKILKFDGRYVTVIDENDLKNIF